MAVKQVQVMIDDLTGEEGVDIEPVYFVHDHELYRIDLNAENRRVLQEAMAPFAEKGHSLGKLSPHPGSFDSLDAALLVGGGQQEEPQEADEFEALPPGTYPEYDPEQIRAWARGAGIEVSPRGRIANKVLDTFFAFHDAHSREQGANWPPVMWERMGESDAETLKKLDVPWEDYPAYLEFEQSTGRSQAKEPVFAEPAARPSAKRPVKATKHQFEYPEYSPENIRAWAFGAKIEVSQRGRIARKVLDAFFREAGLHDDFVSLRTKFWEMRGREFRQFLMAQGYTWEERSQIRSVEVGY